MKEESEIILVEDDKEDRRLLQETIKNMDIYPQLFFRIKADPEFFMNTIVRCYDP